MSIAFMGRDTMQIRKVRRGKEKLVRTSGFAIRCPVCKTLWLEEIDWGEDYNHGECEHLRFIWNTSIHTGYPDCYSGKSIVTSWNICG